MGKTKRTSSRPHDALETEQIMRASPEPKTASTLLCIRLPRLVDRLQLAALNERAQRIARLIALDAHVLEALRQLKAIRQVAGSKDSRADAACSFSFPNMRCSFPFRCIQRTAPRKDGFWTNGEPRRSVLADRTNKRPDSFKAPPLPRETAARCDLIHYQNHHGQNMPFFFILILE